VTLSYSSSLQTGVLTAPHSTCPCPFKPGPRSRLALSRRYLVPFQTRHQPSRLGIMPQTNNKGCVGRFYLTGKHDHRYLRGTFHTPSPDIMLNSLQPHCSSAEMKIDPTHYSTILSRQKGVLILVVFCQGKRSGDN
jgi:hypothetical protein